jgi:alpha-ribazole phosphatase
VRPPGGESWHDLCTRVLAALDRLQGLAPDVIVVAHFGPILAALQAAENLSAEEALAHRIDPLSVTCLVLGPAPQVLAVNHHV